jgi:hypothetical protein
MAMLTSPVQGFGDVQARGLANPADSRTADHDAVVADGESFYHAPDCGHCHGEHCGEDEDGHRLLQDNCVDVSGLPDCINPAGYDEWNAGHGPCSTYAPAYYGHTNFYWEMNNHWYCWWDWAPCPQASWGCAAAQVCPECGACKPPDNGGVSVPDDIHFPYSEADQANLPAPYNDPPMPYCKDRTLRYTNDQFSGSWDCSDYCDNWSCGYEAYDYCTYDYNADKDTHPWANCFECNMCTCEDNPDFALHPTVDLTDLSGEGSDSFYILGHDPEIWDEWCTDPREIDRGMCFVCDDPTVAPFTFKLTRHLEVDSCNFDCNYIADMMQRCYQWLESDTGAMTCHLYEEYYFSVPAGSTVPTEPRFAWIQTDVHVIFSADAVAAVQENCGQTCNNCEYGNSGRKCFDLGLRWGVPVDWDCINC